MARTFRQVDIILQNHTPELLTLESSLASQGEWGDYPPRIGSIVSSQGADHWQSLSKTEGIGSAAFIRLGSTKGYIEITWLLPNVATDFQIDISTPPELKSSYTISGPSLDQLVVLVTLNPGLEHIISVENESVID